MTSVSGRRQRSQPPLPNSTLDDAVPVSHTTAVSGVNVAAKVTVKPAVKGTVKVGVSAEAKAACWDAESCRS